MTQIEVDDLGALADAWRKFSEESTTILETALRDSFNTTGFFEDVWNRTPKSLWQRYAAQFPGVDIVGISKDGTIKMNKGWREKLAENAPDADAAEAIERMIDEYGQERLANSILPGGPDYRSFRVRRDYGTLSLSLSSSLSYADRMHETKRPAEGDYWTPEKGHGWSAKQSGNKYIEKPLEANNEKIAKEFIYQVDRELHNRGLI